jgi:hypothetical protein
MLKYGGHAKSTFGFRSDGDNQETTESKNVKFDMEIFLG